MSMRFAVVVFVSLQSAGADMDTFEYSNRHFGIAIDLPNEWKITTFKRAAISPDWREVYQMKETDVPDRPSVGKILFTASKERPPYVDAKVEMTCFMPDRNDVFAKMVERKRSIQMKQAESAEATKYWAASIESLDVGEWELGGFHFRYLDEVTKGGSSNPIHRSAFLNVPWKGWIELRVMGCDEQHFNEALAVAGTLRRIDDDPAAP